MDLSKKEIKLIRNYETRLRYASSKEEIAYCRQQIELIIKNNKKKDPS